MRYGIRSISRCLPVVAAPAFLLLSLGCSSDDGLGTRYAVSGTVTYGGKPVPKAKITFVPTGKDSGGHGAAGDVVGGSFTLGTLTSNDGALPGEYKVTVSAREIDEAKLQESIEKTQAKYKVAQTKVFDQVLIAKASKEAKSSLPKKYESPQDSGLSAKVEEHPNTFTFDLKD